MVKTLTTRTTEAPAGKPEGLARLREARTAERAPWRAPAEPAASAIDGAVEPREVYGRLGRTPAAQPAPSTPVEDFRDLARTIERRRLATAEQPAAATTPARSRTWLDDAGRTAVRRDTRPAAPPPGDDAVAGLPHDVAQPADKADVARLEGLLSDVLSRLRALEDRRGAERVEPQLAAPADEGRTDAEARWAARRARAAAQRHTQPAPDAPAIPARAGSAPRRLWS
jgi:hypothetical protein